MMKTEREKRLEAALQLIVENPWHATVYDTARKQAREALAEENVSGDDHKRGEDARFDKYLIERGAIPDWSSPYYSSLRTDGEPLTLPDCMVPDGAEPCRGYQELRCILAQSSRIGGTPPQLREAMEALEEGRKYLRQAIGWVLRTHGGASVTTQYTTQPYSCPDDVTNFRGKVEDYLERTEGLAAISEPAVPEAARSLSDEFRKRAEHCGRAAADPMNTPDEGDAAKYALRAAIYHGVADELDRAFGSQDHT